MIHEVLLALSGHPSPLFDDSQVIDFPLVTPAESALLASVGRLARLNRSLKSHVNQITRKHPSAVCRSVANAIEARHLAEFQNDILRVEKQVLSTDSSLVGAYNIVSLAKVVSSFDGWRRKLEWFWDLASFMLPSNEPVHKSIASGSLGQGPATINKLREGCSTGYPDVEAAATDLTKAAETTWLRLVSAWLLKGDLTGQPLVDSFLQERDGKLVVAADQLPNYMTVELAESLLYVGKTLNYLHASQAMPGSSINSTDISNTSLVARVQYVQQLSSLSLPISATDITRTVISIRSLLSKQLTYSVLPVDRLIETLSMLRDFFLCHKGNFADAIIVEADSYLSKRSSQIHGPPKRGNLLAGIVMRDSEASRVLVNTWASMSSRLRLDQSTDPQLEWARDNVVLTLGEHSEEGKGSSFDIENTATSRQLALPRDFFGQFLLATPAHLSLAVRPPMDLFLASKDVEAYAVINSYLVAIRRSHMHTSNLWKESMLRKGASVASTMHSSYKYRMFTSKKTRERSSARERSLRPVWASLSLTVFFLAELGEYLHSEVITESWSAFYNWFKGYEYRPRSIHSNAPSRPGTASTRPQTPQTESLTGKINPSTFVQRTPTVEAQHDPEVLSEAHRQYLSALLETLLLTREGFTRCLTALLTRTDQLIALILRLEHVQSNLDLHDEGVDDGFSEKYASEEREVFADMLMATNKVKASLKQVIDQLRSIDAIAPTQGKMQDYRNKTGFSPWNNASVDRLLMRLDLKLTSQQADTPA